MEERFKSAVCVDLLLQRKVGDKSQVLLMRRKNTGEGDGEYELAGGHLESGEDLFDAMIREAKEELLIDMVREDLKIVHIMHHFTGKRINIVFGADGESFSPKIGEPDKCDRLEWFNIDNLPQSLSSKMRTIIANVKDEKMYDYM